MKKKRIVVYFPHKVDQLIEDIREGLEPREKMYGIFELFENEELSIQTTDHRFKGIFWRIQKRLRKYGFNLIHPFDFLRIYKSDLVIVKDEFSFTTSLFCRVIKKPIVYYDSMFLIPKNKIKRLLVKNSLNWCQMSIGYSQDQVNEYCHVFDMPHNKFKTIEFALDPDFYQLPNRSENESEFILSIGRDMGRDFPTLIHACKKANLKLKVVTLPYLLAGVSYSKDDVDVLQYVSYTELFYLYANAKLVVIPLKNGLKYPSGIRAVLEALQLRKKVLISSTDFVKENFSESSFLQFVKPEDKEDLANKLLGFDDMAKPSKSVVVPNYYSNIEVVHKIVLEILGTANEK